MGHSMHFVPSLEAYMVPHPKALYWILGWEGKFLGFMHAHAYVRVSIPGPTQVGQETRLSSGLTTD